MIGTKSLSWSLRSAHAEVKIFTPRDYSPKQHTSFHSAGQKKTLVVAVICTLPERHFFVRYRCQPSLNPLSRKQIDNTVSRTKGDGSDEYIFLTFRTASQSSCKAQMLNDDHLQKWNSARKHARAVVEDQNNKVPGSSLLKQSISRELQIFR